MAKMAKTRKNFKATTDTILNNMENIESQDIKTEQESEPITESVTIPNSIPVTEPITTTEPEPITVSVTNTPQKPLVRRIKRETKSKKAGFLMRPSLYDRLWKIAEIRGLSMNDAAAEAITMYCDTMEHNEA